MTFDSPLVEVIDLSFRHPGRTQPTIAGVNLTLYPGEIVLIAGATGSGKSTLLNCVAGIAPSHTGGELKGKIVYQGTDLGDWSVRRRSQHFCILLQNVETQIFTDRVGEEFVFGLENWNVPPNQIKQQTDAALREFGLEAQQNWYIRQLSAGQKQRLLLACLLAIGQPVLVLDEPLAYLDANGVEQLLQLLKDRADRGQSVLLVEHRIDVVRKICDRAYYFQQGKLIEGWGIQEYGSLGVESGSTKTLSSTPAKPLHETPVPSSVSIVLHTYQLSWGGYPPFPDLQVVAGETVLLKGDNGCGKTTLLKLLSGLLKPTTGRIEVLGRDVTKRSVVQIAKNIGFVLQNPNHQLFADSVRSEIFQPGVPQAVAEWLLEQLNLSEFSDKHPQSLSQGQKRRLALGAVLARQPLICLLDEIMVGQDPHSLLLMLNVLENFTQQGGVLILTSHVPLAAEALNARLFELNANVKV
jgi:energy-coupling factor transport system ATP-binding protein